MSAPAIIGITAAVVIAAGIGVIIALNAAEHRRLRAARRRYAADRDDQGVNGDTIATLRRWQRGLDAQLDEWEAEWRRQDGGRG